MEVADVVDLCYSSGWRDKNLITMVSIVGAETEFNENFSNPDAERYGLFALKPLYYDHIEYMYDPEKSVQMARKLYEDTYFDTWPTFATGLYLQYVKKTITGVGDFYLDLLKKELLGSKS